MSRRSALFRPTCLMVVLLVSTSVSVLAEEDGASATKRVEAFFAETEELLHSYYVQRKAYPLELIDLKKEDESWPSEGFLNQFGEIADPWNQLILYARSDGQQEYALLSRGPDKTLKTEDDIVIGNEKLAEAVIKYQLIYERYLKARKQRVRERRAFLHQLSQIRSEEAPNPQGLPDTNPSDKYPGTLPPDPPLWEIRTVLDKEPWKRFRHSLLSLPRPTKLVPYWTEPNEAEDPGAHYEEQMKIYKAMTN